MYTNENFEFSFTELHYYHYLNNVLDVDLVIRTLQVVPMPFGHAPSFFEISFLPGTTESTRFILYFLCPGIKVRHFSKKHGSFLYVEIEIWILGVHIAAVVTTGFRSSVNTAAK